jgi:hypothetical protein
VSNTSSRRRVDTKRSMGRVKVPGRDPRHARSGSGRRSRIILDRVQVPLRFDVGRNPGSAETITLGDRRAVLKLNPFELSSEGIGRLTQLPVRGLCRPGSTSFRPGKVKLVRPGCRSPQKLSIDQGVPTSLPLSARRAYRHPRSADHHDRGGVSRRKSPLGRVPHPMLSVPRRHYSTGTCASLYPLPSPQPTDTIT